MDPTSASIIMSIVSVSGALLGAVISHRASKAETLLKAKASAAWETEALQVLLEARVPEAKVPEVEPAGDWSKLPDVPAGFTYSEEPPN